MIPLSNGRSPRIDQFYATLRTLRSHQVNQDSFNQSEEDTSIEHIRSLGKDIFESMSERKMKTMGDERERKVLLSQNSISKRENLYDKYKLNLGKNKEVKKMVEDKKKVEKEKNNVVLRKDKRYDDVEKKIGKNYGINTLNYTKRIDNEVKYLKNDNKRMEQVQKNKTLHQTKYAYKGNQGSSFLNNYTSVKLGSVGCGVIKRTQQLKQRKQRNIQRIREEKIQKQMKGLTFIPTFTSKKIQSVEKSFQKRLSIASIQKLSRQKQILKQVISCHSFKPMTNKYKQTSSAIKKIWRSESINDKERIRMGNNESKISLQSREGKQQQTANTTMHINLKSLDQLEFIFQ